MNQELPRYIKKRLMRILLFPLRIFPVKSNRVILLNNLNLKYSGNPKFLAEYLVDNYSDSVEVIYAVKNPKLYQGVNELVKFVRFNSFSFFWHSMRSRVFVTNSGGYSYLPLRKSQYVINTHHGGGCYKTNGIDMFGDTPLFRKDVMLSSKQIYLFLSTCRKFSIVNSKSILLPLNKFWEIGMPRNDILINENLEYRQSIRSKLGLNDNDRLVLYAPTYRKPQDNYFNDSIAISYGIDCVRVCDALNKRFGGNWIFGFRLHPCVTNRNELPEGDVIDLSDYEEMQELLLAADVMINDFSSSMWDFMLTGKPCFIFAQDLQHYVETTKLYTPVEDWPFPIAEDNDELERNITGFNEESYREACNKHYKELGGCESGHATKTVCDKIVELCEGKQASE